MRSDLSPQKGGERLSQTTSPFIGFALALSGNTVSASTRSDRPNCPCSTPLITERKSVVGLRSRAS